MNHLISVQPSSTFEGVKFGTLIRTDITLKNGTTAAIVTLLTEPQLFDPTVMEINRGLKAGGYAESWQTQTFSLCNGTAKPFATYPRTYAEDIESDADTISGLRRYVAILEHRLAEAQNNYNNAVATLQAYNNRITDDIIAAHKKIGGLHYVLESHGIEIPEDLK